MCALKKKYKQFRAQDKFEQFVFPQQRWNKN